MFVSSANIITTGTGLVSPQFVAASSKRMTRTFGANPTTRTKCGFSFWTRRPTSVAPQVIFAGYDGSSASSSRLEYNASFPTRIGLIDSAGAGLMTTDTAMGANPTLWHHVVFSYDSTQASSFDRVKAWANNVFQNLGVVASPGAPTLNMLHQFCMNNANNRIGAEYNDTKFLGAYLRDFHFIDGLTVTPGQFGVDVSGTWTAITYAGSYGTNGFKLALGETNVTLATLGSDVSGNINNWTPVNF